MSEAAAREQVTLATATIHNPEEPRHFMRIKPAGRRVRVLRGDQVLADSTAALRVIEAGRDLYDPVLYLPRADVVLVDWNQPSDISRWQQTAGPHADPLGDRASWRTATALLRGSGLIAGWSSRTAS